MQSCFVDLLRYPRDVACPPPAARGAFPTGGGRLEHMTWGAAVDGGEPAPVALASRRDDGEARIRAAELRYRTLVEQIPDPGTVRSWLADSLRRSELLRSLLRVAIRKEAFDRTADPMEGVQAHPAGHAPKS